MKILGKSNEGFITSLTNTEMKALLAMQDARKDNVKEKIQVGDDLTFTTALTNLNLLKDISLSDDYRALDQLKKAKKELDRVIEVVENSNSSLIKVQKEIKVQQA